MQIHTITQTPRWVLSSLPTTLNNRYTWGAVAFVGLGVLCVAIKEIWAQFNAMITELNRILPSVMDQFIQQETQSSQEGQDSSKNLSGETEVSSTSKSIETESDTSKKDVEKQPSVKQQLRRRILELEKENADLKEELAKGDEVVSTVVSVWDGVEKTFQKQEQKIQDLEKKLKIAQGIIECLKTQQQK